MARAAHEALGARVEEMLVVAPSYEEGTGLPPGARLVRAGHPAPDEGSLEAGAAALSLAARLRPDDLLLVLLSGGGSSLMAAPTEGLSLADKSRAISLLMAAGAPIAEINAVRGALSRVKAGWLSTACGGAEVVTLVLSDLGDDGWHLVASGPTLGIPPSPAGALSVLDRYRVAPLLPPAVRALLALPPPPAPARAIGARWSVLLADIRTALEGARLTALRLGADARVVPELLSGEARAAARRLAVAGAAAGHLWRRGGGRPLVTLFGGETTVTVKGTGRGGRNRELALATALHLGGVAGAVALVAGTDGVDHERDAAGAFVDGTTVSRAEAAGLDPWKALRDNDTGPFFAALGDAFSPGPTGTNVGDIAFVFAPGRDAGPAGG
jgi:glycerate 2-kinase